MKLLSIGRRKIIFPPSGTILFFFWKSILYADFGFLKFELALVKLTKVLCAGIRWETFLYFSPCFSFLLWEYYFLRSCLTIAIYCINSREAMCFQPWLVVFGEGRWGIGPDLAWPIQRCFLFLRGAGPSKAGGPAGRTLPTPWEEGYLFLLSFFSVLSVSRGEALPEQMGPVQKAFPSHCPLQPHLSPFPLLTLCPLPHMPSCYSLLSSKALTITCNCIFILWLKTKQTPVNICFPH